MNQTPSSFCHVWTTWQKNQEIGLHHLLVLQRWLDHSIASFHGFYFLEPKMFPEEPNDRNGFREILSTWLHTKSVDSGNDVLVLCVRCRRATAGKQERDRRKVGGFFFFFTLTKYGREDVWKSVIVLVCGYKTQSWLFVQYWKDRFILVIESSLKSFVLLFIST